MVARSRPRLARRDAPRGWPSIHPAAVAGLIALALPTGCGSLCDEAAPSCDVRDRGCQERLLEAMACVRGSGPDDLPPIRVVTPDALEAELSPGTMDGMTMMTPNPMASGFDRLLALLGLLPEGTTRDGAESDSRGRLTQAFYSSATREIVLVDRGRPADDPTTIRILVHELVHAAQDVESDLYARARAVRTHDDAFRFLGSVEGEASMVDLLFGAWQSEVEPSDIDWRRTFEAQEGDFAGLLDTEPRYVWGSLLSAYLFGTRWQYGRWREGIELARAVERGEPALATELLVDPFRRWQAAAPSAVDCPVPDPPTGLDLDGEDVFGPALLLAFLRGQGASYDLAWQWSLDLAGDQLVGYDDGDRTVALWRLRFGSAGTAASVGAALGRSGTLEVIERDDTVTILAATDALDLSRWRWPGPERCRRRS